jgi:molybdenum cofactor cytidylyltransferase
MGRQKLLLPLGGQPVIARVVDEVSRSAVDKVFVVVSPDGEPIRQTLAGRPITFILNPNPETGMLGSVRCGLRALPPEGEAVLVVLGDQPGLTAQVVDLLLGTFRRGGGRIVAPVWQGRRGHPVLVSLQFRDELLNSHDQSGLRGLLHQHSQDISLVEANTPAVLEDMDTPEDYQRIADRFMRGPR